MKKKLFIILGLVFIAIALVSYWGYNKYFKPDPKTQQQLNSQFGADFFNFDEADKKPGPINKEKFSADLAQKIDIPTLVSIMEKAKTQEDSEQTSMPEAASTSEKETNVAKQVTQEAIDNKYKNRFMYLQSAALSRLDTLYSAAAQEYAQNKKTGTLNRSELAQKYIQAGTMLESSMDNEFNSTLNAMQAELIANNLPTDSVGIYKSNYEKAKSAKRSQLLAKMHM